MNRILIVDDEAGVRNAFSSILQDEGYTAYAASDALEALSILEQEPINVIFLDVLLPRMGGLEALEKIHHDYPDLEIIMISGHANVDMAVKAVKSGAFDFLEKPLSLERILTVTKNALLVQKLKKENVTLKRTKTFVEEIIGSSPVMQKVHQLIEQAANSDARVLITGEHGTGKELVAQAIHYKSSRAAKPFVEVNCAAIPDSLIESELFGHEKGAYTDAITTRKGRFELANGGTLFLDEIGDMSLTAQAKVLRAIQEQQIERLGSEETISIDVRIVAATNKNLEEACQQGKFREDLYFRLNVIPISLPPLRERVGDIPELLEHFFSQSGAPKGKLSSSAIQYLQQYQWPGNIRELKNFAERLSILCTKDTITQEDVSALLGMRAGSIPDTKTSPASSLKTQDTLPQTILALPYNEARDLFEKLYLEYKLSENGYIISRTAEVIGMYPSNLHAKIKKHGLRMER
jgi:two-component system nitrogen regulation response regulator NtrX